VEELPNSKSDSSLCGYTLLFVTDRHVRGLQTGGAPNSATPINNCGRTYDSVGIIATERTCRTGALCACDDGENTFVQYGVQPRPSAVNMTLPAERRAAERWRLLSIDFAYHAGSVSNLSVC